MSDNKTSPESNESQDVVATPTSKRAVAQSHQILVRTQRFSIVWLIPLTAALIGLWLVVQSIMTQGPTITIKFKSAEGIEVGKTKIRYKEVDVGQVTSLSLSEDRREVLVKAKLIKSASDILVTDTRFFVVRPRVTGSSISGLSTLLSGPYISADVGTNTETAREFEGLETPPLITRDLAGKEFILHSEQIGSISYGSPIYFRHIEAGHVTQFSLDKDGKAVTIHIFVKAPFDQYVTANTRFWQASGIDVSLNTNGIDVSAESLVSLVDGGLAFQDRSDAQPGGTPAVAGTPFTLFKNRELAMRAPDTRVDTVVMYFPESLRGLSIGAPVDMRGIVIGDVKSINIEFPENGATPRFPVEVNIYPDRLRSKLREGASAPQDNTKDQKRHILNNLVKHGMRAQLRTGNLLTGQLYVALDFFPDAAPVEMNWKEKMPVLPTIGGGLGEIQDTVGRIVKKIDRMPLDTISGDLVKALAKLNSTLANTEKLTAHLNSDVSPELSATLKEARQAINSANAVLSEDAPLQQDVRASLKQVSKAARSLSDVADMLEKNPQSLIFGKERVKP